MAEKLHRIEGERPESKKFTHAEVQYEHPSRHGHDDCGDCVNFIDTDPARCKGVLQPIREEDWCKRFKRQKSKMAEHFRKAS